MTPIGPRTRSNINGASLGCILAVLYEWVVYVCMPSLTPLRELQDSEEGSDWVVLPSGMELQAHSVDSSETSDVLLDSAGQSVR
jgi:hypothetical protein